MSLCLRCHPGQATVPLFPTYVYPDLEPGGGVGTAMHLTEEEMTLVARGPSSQGNCKPGTGIGIWKWIGGEENKIFRHLSEVKIRELRQFKGVLHGQRLCLISWWFISFSNVLSPLNDFLGAHFGPQALASLQL